MKLKTKRLILKPINIKYSSDLFELWSDYEVIKYTNATQISTIEECNERVRLWSEVYTDKDFINNFVILLEDKPIGVIGFPIIDKDDFKCGFYYQIMKKYWGNGYALEAAKEIIKYILSNIKDGTILADSVISNNASINILLKLGFKEVNIERKAFKNNGLELDIVHFLYNIDKNK